MSQSSTRLSPPRPVRVNARAMILVGAAIWLVAGIVVLIACGTSRPTWLWLCAVGFAIGALWSLAPTPKFTGVSGQDSFAQPPEA